MAYDLSQSIGKSEERRRLLNIPTVGIRRELRQLTFHSP